MDTILFFMPLILIALAFSFHWIAGVIVLLFFAPFEAFLDSQNAKHEPIEENASNNTKEFDRLIGKMAVVAIPLKPQGTIEINKKRVNAKSFQGFIETNTTVRIVAADMHGVTVERVS